MWFKNYLDEVGCHSIEEAYDKKYYSKLASCLMRDREMRNKEAEEIREEKKKNES